MCRLPFVLSDVSEATFLESLRSVAGHTKTASVLWLRRAGLPTLDGVVVADWSARSAALVNAFCSRHNLSDLLLRIDKRNERWTARRGGYLIALGEVPGTVRELGADGFLALLLEPASPYDDLHSLTAIVSGRTAVLEIVGPGFDAGDLLRGDTTPHERWEGVLNGDRVSQVSQVYVIDGGAYSRAVDERLVKIGARLHKPAFPVLRNLTDNDREALRVEAVTFLSESGQTRLLHSATSYTTARESLVRTFANNISRCLAVLHEQGIHLGDVSFSASVLPARGLCFWDFFPADLSQTRLLYPTA